MSATRLSVIAVVVSVTCGTAAYAAPAGTVLVAVGDTTALRDGVAVKLARGSEVQSGDTLRSGEASNLQVRFTDESLIALRANSIYRIDDYHFDRKANSGKSLFSLLKGGLRTITGLIGQYHRDDYAVKTVEATIGIRGTHFVLAQCSYDCFEKDGRIAENGLFGGVADGRIVINNQAGSQEFGRNEFFHVVSANTLPKELLAPPSFLRDQLAGQARNKEEAPVTGTAAAGEGKENAAPPTEQQTTAALTSQLPVTTPAAPQIQPAPQFIPAEQAVVQDTVSGGLITTGLVAGQTYPYSFDLAMARTESNTFTSRAGAPASTSAFGSSEAWRVQGSITIIDPARLQQDKEVFFAPLVVDRTPALTFLTSALSYSGSSDFHPNTTGTNCSFRDCIGPAVGTVNFTWSKTAAVDTGSTAAGNLSWGRYTMSATENVVSGTYAGQSNSRTTYEHWATGDPVNFAALPTSGIYSYTWVGGTRPTDQNGNVGAMANGGTIGITFTGAGSADMSLVGAAWAMPSGNSYTLNISPPIPVRIVQAPYAATTAGWSDTGTRTFISPVTGATVTGAIPGTVTCAGPTCPGGVTATVSPMLFGASGTGLAAGIATGPASSVAGGERTASVQVYKR
ncbi:MAG TPA: FecR family protein [Gallionella sp.]|nr:FecR family protein [Gallionella sp.]